MGIKTARSKESASNAEPEFSIYIDTGHPGQYMGVNGGMTAIFNSNNSLFAILIGDDDNALAIA